MNTGSASSKDGGLQPAFRIVPTAAPNEQWRNELQTGLQPDLALENTLDLARRWLAVKDNGFKPASSSSAVVRPAPYNRCTKQDCPYCRAGRRMLADPPCVMALEIADLENGLQPALKIAPSAAPHEQWRNESQTGLQQDSIGKVVNTQNGCDKSTGLQPETRIAIQPRTTIAVPPWRMGVQSPRPTETAEAKSYRMQTLETHHRAQSISTFKSDKTKYDRWKDAPKIFETPLNGWIRYNVITEFFMGDWRRNDIYKINPEVSDAMAAMGIHDNASARQWLAENPCGQNWAIYNFTKGCRPPHPG